MMHIGTSEIAAFRAGRLDRARIEAIGAHVRECRRCAALVFGDSGIAGSAESLLAGERRPRRYVRLAVAAMLLIALAIWITRDDPRTPPRQAHDPAPPARPPVPAPVRVIRDGTVTITVDARGALHGVDTPRPEWNALAAAALRGGTIPSHDRAGLTAPGQVLRGRNGGAAELTLQEPIGVVVESDRPRFRWTGPRQARYRVVVARDGAVVARSPLQAAMTWSPSEPLPRGATYAWQVTAVAEETETTVPAPDQPQARFRVLSRPEADELDAARRSGSRLLTGLVASRAGLLDLAWRELGAFAAAHPELAGGWELQRAAPTATNPAQ